MGTTRIKVELEIAANTLAWWYNPLSRMDQFDGDISREASRSIHQLPIKAQPLNHSFTDPIKLLIKIVHFKTYTNPWSIKVSYITQYLESEFDSYLVEKQIYGAIHPYIVFQNCSLIFHSKLCQKLGKTFCLEYEN